MALSRSLFHASFTHNSGDDTRSIGHLILSCRPSIAKMVVFNSLSHATIHHSMSQIVARSKKTRLLSQKALLARQDVIVPTEEEEGLIDEIKDELAGLGHDIGSDLIFLQALNLVDLTERLGIQRYFEAEIESILHHTFTQWDAENGLRSPDATVAAFRLLRLHGYPVSAGVLESLMNGQRGFHACFSVSTEGQVLGMINLYKCSQLGFPCETKIMAGVKEFATSQLWKALREGSPTLLETNNLRTAVTFALEFPRRYLLPRLESRSIIRQLRPVPGATRKYLQLAKLDLQTLQKLYHEELHELDRWWMLHGFDEVKCARKDNAKILFSIAASLYEPQFSAHRLAFSKTTILVVIVDDLFDNKKCNPEEFRRFNEATKRWDPSLLGDLPLHRLALAGICSAVDDIASESSKIQNRNLLSLFKDLWVSYIDSFAKEAEWMHNKHMPSLEEYSEVAHVSIGAAVITWTSVFLIGEQITEEMCDFIGDNSRFMYLVGIISRLSNDLVGHEREATEGKVATAVSCYMRDNSCSHEEATTHIMNTIESSCQELEWEIYRSRAKVPECCPRAILAMARMACLTYKKGEGFSGDVAYFIEIFEDYLFRSLD